jgi:hypothetical protein
MAFAFQPTPHCESRVQEEAVEITITTSTYPAKTARNQRRVFRRLENSALENAKQQFSLPFTFLMRTSIALCQTE